MAFTGFLIKLGGSNGTVLPMKYMKAESYKATPNQRMETSAKRNAKGYLQRSTVEHMPVKIEFETPTDMTNAQVAELNTLIQSNFTDTVQRKLKIQYYNNETDEYKTATCYMPDTDYTILRVEGNIIHYGSLRYCFIEY